MCSLTPIGLVMVTYHEPLSSTPIMHRVYELSEDTYMSADIVRFLRGAKPHYGTLIPLNEALDWLKAVTT